MMKQLSTRSVLLHAAVVLLITVGVDATVEQCSQTYNMPSGRSCRYCTPGTHKYADCLEEGGSALCLTCPSETWQKYCNIAASCAACDPRCLQPHTVKVKGCTLYENIVCECQEGRYWRKESDTGVCLKHSECPRGSGMVKLGTQHNDTDCRRCIDSYTYSDEESFAACKPCTKCLEYNTTCVVTKDAECKQPWRVTTPETLPIRHMEDPFFKNAFIVAVIAGILLIVTVVILIGYIYRHKHRNTGEKPASASPQESTPVTVNVEDGAAGEDTPLVGNEGVRSEVRRGSTDHQQPSEETASEMVKQKSMPVEGNEVDGAVGNGRAAKPRTVNEGMQNGESVDPKHSEETASEMVKQKSMPVEGNEVDGAVGNGRAAKPRTVNEGMQNGESVDPKHSEETASEMVKQKSMPVEGNEVDGAVGNGRAAKPRTVNEGMQNGESVDPKHREDTVTNGEKSARKSGTPTPVQDAGNSDVADSMTPLMAVPPEGETDVDDPQQSSEETASERSTNVPILVAGNEMGGATGNSGVATPGTVDITPGEDFHDVQKHKHENNPDKRLISRRVTI